MSLRETVRLVNHGTAAELRAQLARFPGHLRERERDGIMLIHVAAGKVCAVAIEVLLELGVDANAATVHQETPLMMALRRSRTHGEIPIKDRRRVACALIEAGAEVNPRRIPIEDTVTRGAVLSFQPPLSSAAYLGDRPLVELLLERGAEINATDYYESTALIDAVNGGHPEIVDLLLEHGADPCWRSKPGNTPLTRAPCTRHSVDEKISERARQTIAMKIARSLLDAGARLDALNPSGWSVLHGAVNEPMPRLVELLLAAGADVSVLDPDGDPILVFAVTRVTRREVKPSKIAPVIKHLRRAGADPGLAGADGSTAAELAREHGLDELVDALG